MILLVPISPEVAPPRAPRVAPAIFTVLLLGLAFLQSYETLKGDREYVEGLEPFIVSAPDGSPALRPESQEFLKLRPLLRIAPSRADASVRKLVTANFLHGGVLHLSLNAIGVFAGIRLCSTFIPFLCSFAIFILGGGLALGISIFVSNESSPYIPHVGASAGLFALMGAYYVYNFRFRTRYFFWFPGRYGRINLRTSWFFFVDVLLLEIVLSLAQFGPLRPDSVDHIAHVVGFCLGMGFAQLLRWSQRWPGFLQTRGEFLYWAKLVRPKMFDPVLTPFSTWLELLEINEYNDIVKRRVCRILARDLDMLGDADVERAFRFFSPTFQRLRGADMSAVLLALLAKGRRIPAVWLLRTPYDCVIQLARHVAATPDASSLLFRFVQQYRRAHPESGDLDRKLEPLLSKLRNVSAANNSSNARSR